MPILQIEHSVRDFDSWKQRGFDADPLGRERSGVRSYRILRLAHDPNRVVVDLEFDTDEEAESFREALRGLWQRVVAEGLIEDPEARILEPVESKAY
ncbi:MAG TPA: hypothetical protein VH721_00255 [Gaiellaceae bacterium]|jgi:hypothetical protein